VNGVAGKGKDHQGRHGSKEEVGKRKERKRGSSWKEKGVTTTPGNIEGRSCLCSGLSRGEVIYPGGKRAPKRRGELFQKVCQEEKG